MADTDPGGYRSRLGLHVAALYAGDQRDRAVSREADGQCLSCGVFRVDGEPPTVHRTGCVAARAEVSEP